MQTYYQFLMTYRHALEYSEIAMLAEHVYMDHSFPKTCSDYNELSSYLEINVDYILNMSLFDETWELYQAYLIKRD